MKLTKYILTGALGLALAGQAFADVTINITGSTAFRSVIHDSILAAMTAETYAYTGATLAGASQAIFKGEIASIPGTTTVRTSWSGSATGIRDVAAGNNVNFLLTTTPTSAGGTANSTAGTDPAAAKFAMSDVFQASTIFTSPSLQNQNVAVVPFVFVANDGAPAAFTNVTPQLTEALYSTAVLPLSLFTGLNADLNTPVYGTGRDSGSGTRITTLAETGYGVFRPVQQWKATNTATAVSEIQFWPTTGTGADANTPGNGGYTSGGNVRDLLGATSSSVTIKDQDGVVVETGRNLLLLAYLGESDALTAAGNGAKILKYNGVDYTAEAVRQGQYTLWGYQHLYNVPSLTTDEGTFRTRLIATIPGNLGTAGIALSTMKVGRGSDGGLVGPQ